MSSCDERSSGAERQRLVRAPAGSSHGPFYRRVKEGRRVGHHGRTGSLLALIAERRSEERHWHQTTCRVRPLDCRRTRRTQAYRRAICFCIFQKVVSDPGFNVQVQQQTPRSHALRFGTSMISSSWSSLLVCLFMSWNTLQP